MVANFETLRLFRTVAISKLNLFITNATQVKCLNAFVLSSGIPDTIAAYRMKPVFIAWTYIAMFLLNKKYDAILIGFIDIGAVTDEQIESFGSSLMKASFNLLGVSSSW